MTPARDEHPTLPTLQRMRLGTSSFGWRPAVLAGLLVLVAGIATVLLDTAGSTAPAGPPAAGNDAHAFLSRYVDHNGRVVRRDQGGDTVSEGQAYGMLIAQSIGDHRQFARIWNWTRVHLQRPDGLFAWRTDAAGKVIDHTPASDADVLIAWALSRATGPGAAGYHAASKRIAAAILKLETVHAGSQLLLAAGPWATGQPASLSPSYWAPVAFSALARSTGDHRWSDLGTATTRYTRELTNDGAQLPPDWARLNGTVVQGEPAPDGSTPSTQYGPGAQRQVVWMANSCSSADRRLAARWWQQLSAPQAGRALALTTSGQLLSAESNAMPLVASAAAALAAGHRTAMRRQLAQAARVQSQHPTYYGGAWLALGEALLRTHRLGGCAGERPAP